MVFVLSALGVLLFWGGVYLFTRLVDRVITFIIYGDSRGPQPCRPSSNWEGRSR